MSHRLPSEGNILTTNYYCLSVTEAGRCRRHFTLSHECVSYGQGDQSSQWHQELPLLFSATWRSPADNSPCLSVIPPSFLTSPCPGHSLSSCFSLAVPWKEPSSPCHCPDSATIRGVLITDVPQEGSAPRVPRGLLQLTGRSLAALQSSFRHHCP